MDNFVLLRRNKELEDLSKKLGFSRTLFLDEGFVVIDVIDKKNLLKKTKSSKKTIIYRPKTEEMLRFALEKTPVDIVLGSEFIHPKDSVHFVRGGLDQISCKIAAERKKTIAFSFSDILNSKDRPKLLARMMLNIKLCKKYKVKMLFSNFSLDKMEMRSAEDLYSFFRVLGGEGKK